MGMWIKSTYCYNETCPTSSEEKLFSSQKAAEATEEEFSEQRVHRRRCVCRRGRGKQARRVSASTKRNLKERDTPSISSPSSGDASSSLDESTTLEQFCDQREPDPVALRRVGKKNKSLCVCCDVCSDWVHCYCADVDYETVSAGSFTCDKCS